MKKTIWGVAAMGALCAVAGAQQAIQIKIDGNAVQNQVTAAEVNGRVLVPVRGVLEQLGATVDYIPATQIVNADKGGMNVQLHLGSRQAMVNGREVTLDVPAQVIHGSTMVPLRFLSEAFGDTVDWNAQTNVVNIITASGAAETIAPGTDAHPQSNVDIQGFHRQPPGIIGTGGGLSFSMTGTPGGAATVQIPGATDEIPMTEVSPGKYEAKIDFPADHPVTLMGAQAIGRLKTADGTKVMVLSNPLDIDTQPPAITNIWPKDTLVPELRPTVNATFNDGIGPGIDPAAVTLLLDGQDVSHNVVMGSSFLTYSPPADLTPGTHTCELKIVDRAGNVNDQKWSFTTSRVTDLAKSIEVQMPSSMAPGQQITITMFGAPSSQATYSIGRQVKDQPMTESSPGVYTATYTIQPGDQFFNDRVRGNIHTQDNQTFELTAPQTVVLVAGAPAAPTFISPVADSAVGDAVAIQGTGPANERVHVWVNYRSDLGGGLHVNGSLFDGLVSTDSSGNFTTGPIHIDPGLASGRDMRFTAHAVAIGWDGKVSPAAMVVFRRS